MTATMLAVLAVNLLGIVEHPEIDGMTPYRIDADGRPYVPAGDGGVVLGVRLGDSAFGFDADHAAPGACLVHPDPQARHALTAYACVGNEVVVAHGDSPLPGHGPGVTPVLTGPADLLAVTVDPDGEPGLTEGTLNGGPY
ncbi:DUF4438 domain-containing protein [Streptosporangium sp. NPDC051023]|uniref:DUF4438 family protein n=1 Tax=Streptosporangium sp. NPDC051023 TaxID=3155410 RepID=UPI0034500D2A